MGLSLIPRLSEERSSGATHQCLEGFRVIELLLLVEEPTGVSLLNPNPIRKNSIGTSIA